MWFDAVLSSHRSDVVFNGTPEEIKQFLLLKVENRENTDSLYVMDGETMSYWLVEQYLCR